ncbi:MAG TPA: prephenate dehydratase [Dehalococcoidales bacterium]|nr:prephenate dehydratase [Dehalococcoidales bacterium]
MSLDELRHKIDTEDDRIVKLIAGRIRQAQEIGQEKLKNGIQIVDTAREERVIEHVKEIARQEKISEKYIEQIYRQVIQASKSVQGIVVAFQGETGAYSEAAAFQYFGAEVLTQPRESFDAVFKAVEQAEVTYGVVPVENSLEGSIARVYDLFLNSALKVRGETELRVIHSLIANPGVTLDHVKRVYSHPQALGQAQAFLRQLNVEVVSTYDTAGSVRMIKEKNITDGAAVASERAAEIYGMKILARQIEDNPNNYTRFFILSTQDSPPTGKDKTSIVFSVKHRPGALFAAMKDFADAGINLTKIESRPTRQRAWEYNFYLDLEGHRMDKKVQDALKKLEENALFLKVLGSYPRTVSNT